MRNRVQGGGIFNQSRLGSLGDVDDILAWESQSPCPAGMTEAECETWRNEQAALAVQAYEHNQRVAALQKEYAAAKQAKDTKAEFEILEEMGAEKRQASAAAAQKSAGLKEEGYPVLVMADSPIEKIKAAGKGVLRVLQRMLRGIFD